MESDAEAFVKKLSQDQEFDQKAQAYAKEARFKDEHFRKIEEFAQQNGFDCSILEILKAQKKLTQEELNLSGATMGMAIDSEEEGKDDFFSDPYPF